MERSTPLAVHGFVLAGGRSLRMGRDKALLEFHGKPMVEIAVEKLRSFCAAVSIVGEREDLAKFAPILSGEQEGLGPAGGIEAALRTCAQDWALFMPVDVPLLPAGLLRNWAADATSRESGEYLLAGGRLQPAFCILPTRSHASWQKGLDAGDRKLEILLRRVGAAERRVEDVPNCPTSDSSAVQSWFSNINTPEDLTSAEQRLRESNG